MEDLFRSAEHKRDASGNVVLKPKEEFVDYIRFDTKKFHELLGKKF